MTSTAPILLAVRVKVTVPPLATTPGLARLVIARSCAACVFLNVQTRVVVGCRSVAAIVSVVPIRMPTVPGVPPLVSTQLAESRVNRAVTFSVMVTAPTRKDSYRSQHPISNL